MKIEIVNGMLCFTGERNEQEQTFLNFVHRCRTDEIVKMRIESATNGTDVLAMSLAATPFPTE
jgi:hypothetical protein